MNILNKFTIIFPWVVFFFVLIFSCYFMKDTATDGLLETVVYSIFYLNSTYVFYILFFRFIFNKKVGFAKLLIVYIAILFLSYLITVATKYFFFPSSDSKDNLVYRAVKIINVYYITILMVVFSLIHYFVRFLNTKLN